MAVEPTGRKPIGYYVGIIAGTLGIITALVQILHVAGVLQDGPAQIVRDVVVKQPTSGGAADSPTSSAAPTTLTISPDVGLPGTTVTVSGGGFAPGETVKIDFDTGELAEVTAEEGRFSEAVTIPEGASSGQFNISAVGETSGRTLSQPFLVESASATPSPQTS